MPAPPQTDQQEEAAEVELRSGEVVVDVDNNVAADAGEDEEDLTPTFQARASLAKAIAGTTSTQLGDVEFGDSSVETREVAEQQRQRKKRGGGDTFGQEVRKIQSLAGVVKVRSELDHETRRAFAAATFTDRRWELAVSFLKGLPAWNSHTAAGVLREGARPFGIWHLSERALEGLCQHILCNEDEPKQVSPAIAEFIARSAGSGEVCPSSTMVAAPVVAESGGHRPGAYLGHGGSRLMNATVTMGAKDVEVHLQERRLARARQGQQNAEEEPLLVDPTRLRLIKWALHIFVLAISNAYAIKVVAHMYKGALEVFGWPIYFARMGGMGCALWTAILYLTMARGFLTKLHDCCPRGQLLVTLLDGHKDLHILAGKAMFAMGIEHTVAHLIGTVPGVLMHDLDKINKLLGCANMHSTPGFLSAWAFHLGALHWPECPMKEKPTFMQIIFMTTPGLTGVALLLTLCLTAYTGRVVGRKYNYDIFWYVHNVTILIWPILLFLHGSNSWVGIGFPLVVFTSTLPILLYAADRILRCVRYYVLSRSVRIVHSTIRPGRTGGSEGALTYLRVTKPKYLWNFKPGTYAFLNMPEYAPFQWHPFTICSGPDEPTVDFLIAGVGDWSRELARRCLEARDGDGTLPRLALDGAYIAPTMSALQKKVLIAVGAGVGITPFLSLMATYITLLEKDNGSDDEHSNVSLTEAHFFWMTQNLDEFLFGRSYITKILRSSNLRRKVFLHLHLTAKDPANDPAAFVFREALRRQSAVDRKAFQAVMAQTEPELLRELLAGPQLPWCWVDGAERDVLWVSHLLDSLPEEERSAAMQAARLHSWSGDLMALCGKTSSIASTSWPTATARAASAARAASNSSAGDGFQVHAFSTTASADSKEVMGERRSALQSMVPIVFGRPDFATEIRSIGKARPGLDVNVYVCGNDSLVKSMQDVLDVCNLHAERDAKSGEAPRQKYRLHYERFG
eukprot:TRINITY_DN54537_c0_g1_i1.p1 TRINITY_DN54537_c0_g1~~TRINITY_DN54537_c0_g1_i1.p1  ORF type:complete len:1018 (-),score=227.25 TRINITY_DN54537_c0_g1_i1:154-3051(-)